MTRRFGSESKDVKDFDQPTLKPEKMTDRSIDNHVTFQVTHDLVNLDNDFITFAFEALGIHSRVNLLPLTQPVITNGAPALNRSPFQSICPDHVRMHSRQRFFDVAGVERLVERPQQFVFSSHEHD